MFYIIVILAAIFAMPAKGFDGTPLPNNPMPAIKAAPDLPLCGYASCLAQANPGGTAGQGVDPLVGTWKFNPQKSTANIPLVKSFTNTYAGEGQNLTNTSEGVDAQGQPFKSVARHIYDGMPHPTPTTINNPDYDASAYTRVGNTINAVRFRQGKAVEVAQLVIVPGKSITGNAEGIGDSS
jgi:hypothetical protein